MRRPFRTALRLFVPAATVTALITVATGPAAAACHAFTVEVDPATPAEGETVTVTIRRDAAVNPSSVRVRTVEGTATGGADYAELDERVEFDTGTEQTRTVDVLDDDAQEDDETFDIELSEGEGCEVNPDFTYDSATVTIQDDDPAPGDGDTDTGTDGATATDGATDTGDSSQTTDQQETATDDLPRTGGGSLAALGLPVLLGAYLVRRRPGSSSGVGPARSSYVSGREPPDVV